METQELFYPQIAAQAGPYTFEEGVEIELYSSQDSYFDWAKIRFTEEYQPEISVERKAPAFIRLGYDGNLEDVFEGYVAKGYDSGGFANEINLKDEMLLLEETEINNTFLNTTPQEMISYFLGQAGVTKSKLSPEIFPERRQVPIKKMSVIQAINAVHAAWGIKKKFFFSGGVFYWGEKAGAEESDSLRVWCECSHLDPLGRRLGARDGVRAVGKALPQNKHRTSKNQRRI